MAKKMNDTGSKIIIENGEIKTIYSEEIKNNGGWMSVEEMRRLLHESINKRRELLKQNENIKK